MTLQTSSLAWLLALVATLGAALIYGLQASRNARRRGPEPLPTQWSLKARPVFSSEERRAYCVLREALPHHVVLAKVPLVRFCQPEDLNQVEYWYELLGPHHVTFAVCSANGRVLAAIDLESSRTSAPRTQQIKQSVLEACRIRYLQCTSQTLPSAAELQLLVPANAPMARAASGPGSAEVDLHTASATLATTVASRRAARSALSHQSTNFQDSFFAPDSRQDTANSSEFGALGRMRTVRPLPLADSLAGLTMIESLEDDDIAGIVEDTPAASWLLPRAKAHPTPTPTLTSAAVATETAPTPTLR